MRLGLIDLDTGEKIQEISEQEIVKIISKEQSEGYKKKVESENKRNAFVEKHGNFIFKSNKEKEVEITESDEVRLAYISTYVDYDGILRINKNEFINKSKLFKLINVKRSIFDSWYEKMIEGGIISEVDWKLILNKAYYNKGALKIQNGSHTRIFINAMRNLYESNIGKNLTTIYLS